MNEELEIVELGTASDVTQAVIGGEVDSEYASGYHL
jgi:hypothetical protein